MIIDQTLQRHIAKILIEENKKRKEEHMPSGKLSASRLGHPVQWQILHSLGVPPKELEEYKLRKFQRGNHVEDWLVSNMIGLLETQKEVEYKDVVGYVDTIIDTKDYESNVGIICNEIKSVTNANFKWITKRGTISPAHALQGALYSLSQGHRYFAVTYVASDDYRIHMMIEETAKYKTEIEQIIGKYNHYKKKGTIPVFEEIESWNSKDEYNPYPDWKDLSQEEINMKAKEILNK